MTITSADALLEACRLHQLLEPGQLQEMQGRRAALAGDAKTLAAELIQRGWLTAYQVNHLFKGQLSELILGPYLLLERLGEGGMGQVFKARHRFMDRVVAIKIIRRQHLSKPEAVRRFQREIELMGQLSSEHVVMAYDAAQTDDTHFLVMEFVDGVDLGRLVRKSGPMPVEQACDCIRQAALGLQHAFQHGLVHRDIKPSNLLLTHKGGVVKILDLGLARYDESLIDERGGHLTQMGRLVGTPDFMAPEQARNARSADIRADLYSLGCTFYYLLTGRPPFPEGTTVEKILKHQSSAPVPVSQLRSDVPPGVTAILDRLLAKSPAERYQTPAELVKALDAVRHATPPPKPAVPLAAPVVAAPVSDSMAFAVDPPLPTLRSPPRPRPARTAPGWFGVRVRVGAAIAGLVLFLALVTWAAWPRGTEQGRKLPPPSPAGSARSGGDRR